MTRPRILVTGGTGFLGKSVVPLLREKFDVDVISRSGRAEVQGDLCHWNAGLDLEALKKKKYSLFLHMAGLYDLTAAHVDCFQHNISSMGIALKVAEALQIPFFVNTSTVAAGINSPLSLVKAMDLNFSKPFPDPYSESKALGERLLQNWPVVNTKGRVNLRLGVLVGDTVKGEIDRIDGPYHAPESFRKIRTLVENLPTALVLPGNERTRLPIVPVDTAAKAVVSFCEWTLLNKPEEYLSFHITPREGLAVKALYAATLKAQAVSHKGIVLVNQVGDKVLSKVSKYVAKFPEEQLYYLLHFPLYDSKSTRDILGENWCPEFAEYETAFWSGYEAFISNRRN